MNNIFKIIFYKYLEFLTLLITECNLLVQTSFFQREPPFSTFIIVQLKILVGNTYHHKHSSFGYQKCIH